MRENTNFCAYNLTKFVVDWDGICYTVEIYLRIENFITIFISSKTVFKGENPTHVASVSVSAQDGIVALGKAHTCSAPSFSSLCKVALKTVPVFVWLNTNRSRPPRVVCRLLSFSIPLSFRQPVLWCSGLSMFRKFLKPQRTSALSSCRPGVLSDMFASLSVRSFPLTSAYPGQ